MAAISSIIAGIAAGAAAAGTGYAVVAGERGASMQQQAMNQQKKAQDASAAAARSQQRRSQQAMAAANRAEPNVAGIMGAAEQLRKFDRPAVRGLGDEPSMVEEIGEGQITAHDS